jgi:hypothetical protein
VAAAAWCAVTTYQILDTGSETESARQQTAQLEARYQQATRHFPAAPTTAENLKRAVEISHKIAATTRSPEFMMGVVSAALDEHRSIVLKAFGWKYDRAEIDADAGMRAAKLAQEVPVGGAAPGAPAGAGTRKQSGLIEGEVRPFGGDYRIAIDAINRFAEALAKQPEVAEVRVVKLPLNINPGMPLSGNTDSTDRTGTAEFKLLLVLKQS